MILLAHFNVPLHKLGTSIGDAPYGFWSFAKHETIIIGFGHDITVPLGFHLTIGLSFGLVFLVCGLFVFAVSKLFGRA